MYRDIHHIPCWNCEGKESCSYYSKPEPHLNCFRCGEQLWDLKRVEEHMTTNKTGAAVNTNFDSTKAGPFPLGGSVEALENRGITETAARKFGVTTVNLLTSDGQEKIKARVYPFYNPDTNELVAQKMKKPNKDIRWVGNFSKSAMFGQNVFPAGGKYLTITEGEEDAMAAYQMLKTQTANHVDPAVISVRSGASSAKNDGKLFWEYINSFENIIICFDNDTPGQKAAEEFAELFPKKSRIVKLSFKDANEYLLNNKTNEFNIAWRQAERVVPSGIIPSSKTWDAMVKKNSSIQVSYPWDGLNQKLFGIRTSELVVVKAPPKVGKTQLLREIARHIKVTTSYNVGVVFLEESLKRISLGFCALEIDRPIFLPDAVFTEEELKEAYEKAMSEDRYFIFDPQSERTADNIVNKITYFAKAFDCRFILLDHISMLVYDLVNVDERKVLDKIIKELKDLTVSLDVGIVAVQHVNDEGKTRGSRAAYQLCDAMIDLSRDKLNSDEFVANTTIVTVEENRVSGDSGVACKLYYDRDTGRLRELTQEEFSSRMTEQSFKNLKFEDDNDKSN